ncbi:MAG: ribosome maturation factor RimM [Rhodospirillaceae bacterium]|jgi:16S rRNA processing protein RimM|nr:ribosome maturation factor RimM [Rhodospirillaceae bacterium]
MFNRVCVGIVLGAHGLKGAIRIKSFTDRATDVVAYGEVEDEVGQHFQLRLLSEAKGIVTVMVDGKTDRDSAEAMKGAKLYISRSALPVTKIDEFYYHDLVGMAVILVDETKVGTVKRVVNFGGGDIIEIVCSLGDIMLPFNKEVVPVVDVARNFLMIKPITLIDNCI